MSTILYYSNFCQYSKNLLQTFGKSTLNKDVHFICIDKRSKDANGKTNILLENGQQIILPDTVTKVPALLLLKENYKVLYGESILQYFKPKQEAVVKQATFNNIEPLAFSLGGGSNFGIMSDQFSFLDMEPDALTAKGNGGMRQMHNYVDLNTAFSGQLSNYGSEDTNTTIRGTTKKSDTSANSEMEARIKQMQAERDADIKKFSGNRPPVGY